MEDPIWISKELTLAIHSRQLAEHGGQDGTRDEGLLESALARPRQMFAYTDPTPDAAALAAALAYGIARNHPFIDGNKRTAYVACRTFMILDGIDMIAPLADRYAVFLGLAEGTVSEAQLAEWLREHSETS